MSIGTLAGYPVLYRPVRSLLIAGMFFEEIAPSAASQLDLDDQIADLAHDSTRVLGRKSAGTLVLTPDTKGIRATIALPRTSFARDLKESYGRGDTPAWSFTFRAAEDEWRHEPGVPDPIRTITKMRLIAVSPGVAHPAYPDTATARGAVRPLPIRRSANDLAAAQLAVKFLDHLIESRNLGLRMRGIYTTSPPRLVECESRESRLRRYRNQLKQWRVEASLVS
jgi:hypothetical protein